MAPVLVSAASADFSARHPDMVARYLKVFRQATRFIRKTRSRPWPSGIEEHGISMEEACPAL